MTRIPARSQRQAMDWSLVLASQGIEPIIERADDDAGAHWALVVSAQEHPRALSAIHQYRLENRRWPWQQKAFTDGLLFDWGSLGWLVLIFLFYWFSARVDLRSAGVMDSSGVAHGQWWRLFTAVWLHADVSHLAANATLGFVLLGLALARYGTGVGLLGAYLAGVAGNVAACVFSAQPHFSLGASGMVMGGLGLLAVQSLSLWRPPHKFTHGLSGLGAGVMLFLMLALGPNSDIIAHLGGFVSGAVLGGLMGRLGRASREPVINVLSGLVFTLLVIVPWWLALRSP
jgi:rhomboid protease GluP